MDSISRSMADLRLSGISRTFNSGIGSSNMPVVESVRSRLERENLDLDYDEEDFEVNCDCCCVSDDSCHLLGSSESSNQTSEGDFFRVDSRYANPNVDPLYENSHVDSRYANLNVDARYENYHVDSRYANPRLDPRYVGDSNAMNGLAFFNTLTTCDIARLAMCKKGCSYFHYMLDQHDPNIRNKIVKAVVENLFELMVNLHGNILFQFILGKSSSDEFKLIFAKMAESLIIESKTDYGSSSVLKLIQDFRQSPLIRLITAALADGVYTLMTNQRGTRVIYTCFRLLDSYTKEHLSEAVAQHCIPLSTHVLGCTSLMQCLEFITGAPRDRLLDTIAHYSLFLAEHSKGNYVLQHVLELQNPIINDKICSLLYGNYVHLSCIKIGSHVVETCLGTSGMHYVIEEFLARNKILDLAKDEYGNYVVQRSLSKTQVNAPLTHGLILSHLIQNINSLKRHPYGKIVCSFIKEKYPAALK